MKRIGLAIAALLLTGCGTTYTFEAVPEGVDEDVAEQGIPGEQMEQIKCFFIEADSSAGDDAGDKQLGKFCKVNE